MDWLKMILDVDRDAFLLLNGLHNDFWDTLMFFITRKETWLPMYIVLLYFFIRKYRNKAVIIIIMLTITIIASDQISVVLKETIQRLRPVHDPEIGYLVHNYFRKGGLYGFVSSHATNAFALLTFSSYIFKNRIYLFTLLIWAVILCYSRIYLGVHYPLDILAGMLIGYIIGYIFFRITMFVENHFFIARQPKISKISLFNSNGWFIFFVFIIILTTLLISARNLHYLQFG